MIATAAPWSDGWRLEIITVRGGSHTDGERSAIRRLHARGMLTRLGRGSYVDRADFERLEDESRHVVRMRAFVAATDRPVVFSHWSAAVLHGLPVLRSRLNRLHVTVASATERSGDGIASHVFATSASEVCRIRELVATDVGRTVVDVAGAGTFEEGVMCADAALRAGVPRDRLRTAALLAGPRRAQRRIDDTISFAHPGAESAAESRWRCTAMRAGFEVPTLQFRIRLDGGSVAYLDGHLPRADVGVEVDGDRKYLDPAMAPRGTGRALVEEKRREDDIRTRVSGLLRIGWVQAGSTSALRSAFARIGVTPTTPRTTLAAYADAAAVAAPRRR